MRGRHGRGNELLDLLSEEATQLEEESPRDSDREIGAAGPMLLEMLMNGIDWREEKDRLVNRTDDIEISGHGLSLLLVLMSLY